jgi:hypothetical protein
MDCCWRVTWATRSSGRIPTAPVGILVRALRGNDCAPVHDDRPTEQSDVYQCFHPANFLLVPPPRQGRCADQWTRRAFLKAVIAQAPGPLLLKSPTHTFRLPWIAERFPDAQFIWLIRAAAKCGVLSTASRRSVARGASWSQSAIGQGLVHDVVAILTGIRRSESQRRR